MIQIILGGAALTAVGYGIAKLLEDDCNCIEVKENKQSSVNSLEKFYSLKEDVYNTSYQEFQVILGQINNLSIDEPKKIVFKNNLLKTENYKKKVYSIADELYLQLNNCNILFKGHIVKVLNILESSNDYESYSKDDKRILDNTLVLSNTINNILNVKLINKHDKLTKSYKQLLKRS